LPIIEYGELVGSINRQFIVHTISKWNHDRGLDFAHEKKAQDMVDHPSSTENIQKLANCASREQMA